MRSTAAPTALRRSARAEIAGDARFEIVEIDTCPATWAGKAHTVHAGITRSRAALAADYLLFVDADTTFAPGCIAAALALMRERRLDLLSLLSTLAHDTWFERIVQTAASFELMRQYPLRLANAPDERRAFANGQFMLFRRDAYVAIGGHEAVKDALLEDLALARRIVAAKRTPGVFLAAGLFRCRMYTSWPEFRRGWKRIYIEAASRKAKRLSLLEWRIRWLGTIMPVWMLATLPIGTFVVARDPALGWTLVTLSLVALGRLDRDRRADRIVVGCAAVDWAAAHSRRVADGESVGRGRGRRSPKRTGALGRARIQPHHRQDLIAAKPVCPRHGRARLLVFSLLPRAATNYADRRSRPAHRWRS